MTIAIKPVQSKFIYEIAKDARDNGLVNSYNKDFVDAMENIRFVDDPYYYGTGRDILIAFLSHTNFSKVDKAQIDIKNECKALVKR